MDLSTGLPKKTLAPEAIDFFKKECNVDVSTTDEAANNKEIMKMMNDCVAKANARIVSNAARIKKFKILTLDFSAPGGELTPTMKLRRDVTMKKYAKEVAAFYAEPKL